MNRQDRGNRKTRSRSAVIAGAPADVEAGTDFSPICNGVIATQKPAQPDFDFDIAGQPGSRDKSDRSADVNRIQFSSAADSDLALSGETIPAVRKPIAFARRLAGTTMRLQNMASGPLLLARTYARFRGIIHRVVKRLLQRQGRCRKLQLLEIQQLGEKRFIAMVRVGRQKFLIGGAATSVSLLAEIDSHKTTAIAPRPLEQETA